MLIWLPVAGSWSHMVSGSSLWSTIRRWPLVRRETGDVVSSGLFSLPLPLFKPAVERVGKSFVQSPLRCLTANPSWLILLSRRLTPLSPWFDPIVIESLFLRRQHVHQIATKTSRTAASPTPTKTPTTFPVSDRKPLGATWAAWIVTEAAGGADGVIVTV